MNCNFDLLCEISKNQL